MVDRAALKVNQAFIVGLLLVAFALGETLGGVWLALAVASVMAVGAPLAPGAGLFRGFYRRVLVPLRVLRPRPEPENPMPHRFAEGLGALVLGLALLSHWGLELAALGWSLVWVVIVLAALNLALSF